MFAEMFIKELNLIKDESLRNILTNILDNDIDSYIFEVPASSTGKYHPKFAQGPGGLVRHTKAMVKVLTVFENARPDLDWDCIYSAAIMHDCCKFSRGNTTNNYSNHAELIYKLISSKIEIYKDDQSVASKLQKISELAKYHMGRFDTDLEICKSVMTEESWIIHYADMLVSRKWYSSKDIYV
jgi:23S rRNA maturation-related 3'-5' exoribonuclease YhaM